MFKSFSLPDLTITIPVLLLLSFGVLVIYSSDPNLAVIQFVTAIVGFSVFWFLSLLDFEFYSQYSKYLYILILVLLIIVFLLGIETRGSLRWIPLGFVKLQPSEFAKPVLILCLAYFWSGRVTNWSNIIKSFLLIVPIAALIFKQPDLGTTITLCLIWFFILIGANISGLKLFLMGAGSLVGAPLAWILLRDYQKNRILSFLSPEKDPLGVGYNVIQATIAVGSGQIFGRGLGRGTQSRLQFLPEFRTDFIFASIAEEFGLIGSLIVLSLYGIILGRCLRIIRNTKSRFGSLLVFGALGMLFTQIVINIGMNVGLVPVTGITLPFISYGGSSLLATFICLGFVTSVSRMSRKLYPD